jgi:uncharacterized protein (DUF427 family)
MGKSPGHQKWPDHKVEETRVGQRMEVVLDGTVVADSSDVIRVNEDKHPVRYYFARTDVRMDTLEPSDTRTTCPFKGIARHFNLTVGGRKLEDAAWSYEDPYDEHRDLHGGPRCPHQHSRAGGRASRPEYFSRHVTF